MEKAFAIPISRRSFMKLMGLNDNSDPTAIPEAAAAIVEPGLDAPAKPQAENEQWTITS